MVAGYIGKYQLVRMLGRGGMGSVYEGFDPSIERRVAIKVLHKEYQRIPEIVDRFLNEARAANRIGHPGVVQVSECNTLPDGTAYLVMEFLAGQTLAQRLRDHGGRLPMWMALNIASQMAGTLHWGHERGIVHRDLKPDNVMIVQDSVAPQGERCKLLDFGIAKVGTSKSSSVTQPTTILGTPGYMPPEQMRGASNVTPHSDVYSLGVILFQMIAGRQPFVADTDADLIAMVLRDEAPFIGQVAKDVPIAIADLVQKMLARQAVDRPLMANVQETLDEAIEQVSIPLSVKRSGKHVAKRKSADSIASVIVQDTHVPPTEPGVRPKPSPEPAVTPDERQLTPSDRENHLPRADSAGKGPIKPLSLGGGHDRWLAIASGLLTVGLTISIVLWLRSPSPGPRRKPVPPPVVHFDDDAGASDGQAEMRDLSMPRDLDTPRDLSMAQDLSTTCDLSSHLPDDLSASMPGIRDLGASTPPCPPIFTPRCIHGKNLTSDQIQLFVERLNHFKLRLCARSRLILIREESWFRRELPSPTGVPDKLVTDLLDDLYSYWRAKRLNFANLPAKVEIVCP